MEKCPFWSSSLSSDTWIQRLPLLQKRSAHTHCGMCLDFSTALVVSLSTGLSSFSFSVLSPSSRSVTSMVYHNVSLSSSHIDGQCRVDKIKPSQKMCCFTQFAFFFNYYDFKFNNFDVEREPLNKPTSLESNCSFSTFQTGPHIGCQ